MANVLVAFAIGTLITNGDRRGSAVCYVAGAVKPLIQTPLPGPKAAALIARDARAMSPSFTRAYPFVMERGEGCWVTDVDGNRFLDFTAGIAVVTTGHSHPKVVAAIEEQARRFLHMSGTDFYYEPADRLAERLVAEPPGHAGQGVFHQLRR